MRSAHCFPLLFSHLFILFYFIFSLTVIIGCNQVHPQSISHASLTAIQLLIMLTLITWLEKKPVFRKKMDLGEKKNKVWFGKKTQLYRLIGSWLLIFILSFEKTVSYPFNMDSQLPVRQGNSNRILKVIHVLSNWKFLHFWILFLFLFLKLIEILSNRNFFHLMLFCFLFFSFIFPNLP